MQFEEYVVKFEKTYVVNSTEWIQRQATFALNSAEIARHNANPSVSYKKAINQVTFLQFFFF